MNSPIADDQFQAARLAFQRAKEQHACSCLSEAIESCHETLELLTRAVGEDASEKIPVLLFLADLLIQTDRLAPEDR